ncbi:MAG: phosphocholine cytidylyltransferase family protein [Candidatus Omnitrophica bacterium]|nr:phosphocholine cytidylyltransferase family protein [Candidatus Omnitrophota bacterium]
MMAKPRIVILAAGSGTRLRPYTENNPKCLVKLGGRPLLEWQLGTVKACGIENITIVTGYEKAQLEAFGLPTVWNEAWERTNMVMSLWCAREKLCEDVVIAYSDIVYQKGVLQALLASQADISVVVDKNFLALWQARFENPVADLESLRLDSAGNITDIGQKLKSLDGVQGQYIGLIRCRGKGLEVFLQVMQEWHDSGVLNKVYMTDLLQEIIKRGYSVKAVPVQGGWLEIDTKNDYEVMQGLFATGEIKKFFDPAESGCAL